MLRYLLLILALLPAPRLSAEVNLVVSIKPLQLIAEALLGSSGNVRVLVPESGSPHHYTMTPSDRLALENADLIVYVGEQLETELHAAIEGLGREPSVLRLLDAAGIETRLLSDSDRVDPHIWLHGGNGLSIAAAIRDRLKAIEGSLEQQLDIRYRQLEQQLVAAGVGWQARIGALPALPYAVYHDAIGYFETQFDRRHSLALVEDPEVQPGIRRLMEVRRSIAGKQPVCLFTDITARQSTIDTLFADHPVRQQQLDLMGDRLAAGATYASLLDGLVNDFSSCLAGGAL
jgi:zinc transport system substrate-binding protein